VRNRIGSGSPMESAEQVAINSYVHMFFLVYLFFYLLKLPAPPRAVLLVLPTVQYYVAAISAE